MTGKLCVFGEVLFDIFPDGHRVLGGAPFNVAWHLQAFRQAPAFISRIGKDPEGERILQAMHDWGMSTRALQSDDRLATGQVVIQLQDGEPEYDIVEPAAYDAIEAVADGGTACGFLYHGSLALRNGASRQALEHLQSNRPETVFLDVNLRDPWWDKAYVTALLQQADWVKLNSDEYALLYPSGEGGKSGLSRFVEEFGLRGVILTHGKAGAEVLAPGDEHHNVSPDAGTDVVDAVGAGDAFSSVFILGLINHWSILTTIQRAQAFASAIVGRRGATVADRRFYQPFIENWGLDEPVR